MNDGWREVFRGVVHPWHHDQFGHMNVRWYGHLFDDAVFHLYAEAGIGAAAMEAEHGIHTVSANASTNFIKELKAGDLVRIEGGVSRIGTKSVTITLRMRHVDTGAVHATYDLVEVGFDPKTRQAAALPQAIRDRLQAFSVESKPVK